MPDTQLNQTRVPFGAHTSQDGGAAPAPERETLNVIDSICRTTEARLVVMEECP